MQSCPQYSDLSPDLGTIRTGLQIPSGPGGPVRPGTSERFGRDCKSRPARGVPSGPEPRNDSDGIANPVRPGIPPDPRWRQSPTDSADFTDMTAASPDINVGADSQSRLKPADMLVRFSVLELSAGRLISRLCFTD